MKLCGWLKCGRKNVSVSANLSIGYLSWIAKLKIWIALDPCTPCISSGVPQTL